MYQFARLPFSIVSSTFLTFLLSATVKHHPDEANTIAAKQIEEKIYVNN